MDRGDQLGGYYSRKTKSRKFYKYIYTFLLNAAIMNAFILMKHYCPSYPFPNIKSFHLQLAKELIGEYTAIVAGMVEEELSFVLSLTATFQSHWKTDRMHQDTRMVVLQSMLHLTSVPHERGTAGNMCGYVVTSFSVAVAV